MKIALDRLSVRYGRREVLHKVSMSAEPGQVTGLIGANGSGKSTLVKAIAGLVACEGRVTFDGQHQRPAHLGYMPQDVSARAALSVLEVVLLGRLGQLGLKVSGEDLAVVSAVLRELDIADLAERDLADLSGGQRQLVFLGQALAARPPVLLLDEPVSALDIRHQLQVLEDVRDITRTRALTTLTILHDLNAAARFCDRIGVLKAGDLIAFGPPLEVLTPALIARAYDVEASVSVGPDGHPIITPLRSLRRASAGVQG